MRAEQASLATPVRALSAALASRQVVHPFPHFSTEPTLYSCMIGVPTGAGTWELDLASASLLTRANQRSNAFSGPRVRTPQTTLPDRTTPERLSAPYA